MEEEVSFRRRVNLTVNAKGAMKIDATVETGEKDIELFKKQLLETIKAGEETATASGYSILKG